MIKTSDTIFKGTVEIKDIRFFKDGFGIVRSEVIEEKQGVLQPCGHKDKADKKNMVLKGVMPKPEKGQQYIIEADFEYNEKFGGQYNIKKIKSVYDADGCNEVVKKQYLEYLFSVNRVNSLYNELSNPFETLKSGDIESLIRVKGIRNKNAVNMINKFKENYEKVEIIEKLETVDISFNMVEKIKKHYGSLDIAIEKIKTEPYDLVNVNGISWIKADSIAQTMGMEQYCVERVKTYILYFLDFMAQNGCNYIPTDMLMDGIIDKIGEEIEDITITEAIHSIDDKLWYNEEKTYIGLKKYYELENNIAKELIRIRDAENKFDISGWEEVLKNDEEKQGWEYTEQQMQAIEFCLKNNIVCVTGGAGTGKSTIADGILSVLDKYSSVTTCLAGKAASRIAEITNRDGFTIHKLLGYNPSKKSNKKISKDNNENEKLKNGFKYHDENQLDYDIIIVDEISMIGGSLFYYLLRAIKSGTKVILLGDISQLESIGECNVASDIIKSEEIITVVLDKIHRQAAKSAIITESVKIRKGQQIVDKDFVGTEIRGELKDLLIDCYSDKSNTFYKVTEYFQKDIEKVSSILDLQIIVPMKTRGQASVYEINTIIQELYNPLKENSKQIEIYKGGNVIYLREGDKVINNKNCYECYNEQGICTPIYNGNIGIIKEIKEIEYEDGSVYNKIIVDFGRIGTVILDSEQYKELDLGYAITVHKVQGSQFERIIFALDFTSYVLLSRELVYTAITRAQKHCTLVAQNSALRYAISHEKISEKTSHLVQLLYETAHPKLIF